MIVYNSIDNITCTIFDSVMDKRDYSLLFKNKMLYKILNKLFKKMLDIFLFKTWEKIHDEFIDTFGISEQYKRYMDLMNDALEHYNNVYNEGKRHELVFAQIKEYEAEKCLKGVKKNENIYSQIARFTGFRINPSTITVREFYNYVKEAQGNG